MKTRVLLFALMLALPLLAVAQVATGQDGMDGFNQMDEDGNVARRGVNPDSLGTDKEVPVGLKVWTVDRRFGDRMAATPDTLAHMFPNTIFTTGLRGEYNTTGNLGSPRMARIFIDDKREGNFIFTQPYSFFITPVEDFLFTNTRSPITNVSYNTCGNRTNGEDHLNAKFAVNAGKRFGAGFQFNYLYGRGYYNSQSTSHFGYTMYGSYLGDRYQAHLLFSLNHQKVAENGGIASELYITHPETFNENFATSEIPTMLERNWNRNDNQHVFFTHRYSLGFNRKVPMTEDEKEARRFAMQAQKDKEEREALEKLRKEALENDEDVTDEELRERLKQQRERQTAVAGRPDGSTVVATSASGAAMDAGGSDSTAVGRIKVNGREAADSLLALQKEETGDTTWMKTEYVPVTSFIHTAEFNNYRRIYQAYETPDGYYLNTYNVQEKFGGDSLFDKTTSWNFRNTVAVSLLEGFNKWVKAGAKVFATHELRHYALPDSLGSRSWNENLFSVGAQLSKTQGRTLHFNVTGEVGLVGKNAGEIHIDGGVNLRFPLLRDTVTLAASGFYHHEKPNFYFRHYQSRHLWWDDEDLSMTDHFRAQGVFAYPKTRTRLRVAFDELKNYTNFSTTYTVGDDGRTENSVTVAQHGSAVSVFTAELSQNFTLGPLNWENVLTFQKSTDKDILPLPALNIYSNLYLRFKIARVLACDLGADVRWFTKYNAPEYVPSIGQFANQGNVSKVDIGGYPIANAYLNFKLGRARFFAMMSHINAGNGNKRYFLTPYYPLNKRLLRFGISWTFIN